MLLKILSNVPEDSQKSKFWFILWNLTCSLWNSACKLLQINGEKQLKTISLKAAFSTLLLINNLLSLITVFPSYFFLSSVSSFYVGVRV